MNNIGCVYYPALTYTFLLVSIWIVSLLTSVFQLLVGSDATVVSLVSGEGMRWALLSVYASLESAPWGNIMFLVLIAGLLSGSGVLQFLAKLLSWRKVSNNELRSFVFSVAVLLLYGVTVFMFTVSPWQALLGVTGELLNSPLAHGWLLVLFVGILLMSLVYGFIYGNYRTVTDVIASAGSFVKGCTPAFLAMLPASGIMPCLHYSGLDTVCGLTGVVCGIVEGLLYMLPFVYLLLLMMVGKK